jgi:O-glycosyl hydrolase
MPPTSTSTALRNVTCSLSRTRLLVSLLSGMSLCALSGCGGSTEPSLPVDSGPLAVLTATDTVRITVDNTIAYQTIAGFGATTLPLVYDGTDYLGGLRTAALDAAYRQVGLRRGLMSIGLAEAPAGTANAYDLRQNDNTDPFVINAAGFNFSGLATLRSAILLPGASFGLTSTELGPMLDLRQTLDWLKPVRAASYERYLDESAELVSAVLQQWRSAYGQVPPLIHLFNEPTSGNTELGSTSVQEVVDLVKRIGTRLRADGLQGVRFVVPNEESMARSIEVSRAILADPVARPFVGVIGFHQYPLGSVSASPRRLLATSGSGAPDATTRGELEQLQALGAQYGVPLWMTEVSEGPGTIDYTFDDIANVLARAIHIHDVFRYGGASAYFGINTLWDSRSHVQHFAGRNIPFLTESSSIVLIDLDQRAVKITGMGYAIGHYARWLGADAVRLETTTDAPRTPALGFRDAGRNRAVIVATNTESFPRLLKVRVSSTASGATFTGEVSFGTQRWRAFSGMVDGSTGTASFIAPPRSVVTIAVPLR